MAIRVEDIEAAMEEVQTENRKGGERKGLVERSVSLGVRQALLSLQVKLEWKAAQRGERVDIKLPE